MKTLIKHLTRDKIFDLTTDKAVLYIIKQNKAFNDTKNNKVQ